MKRLISICILLALVFSFAGCGFLPFKNPFANEETQNADTLNQEIDETDPVVEETQEVTEDEVFDDGSIRIDSQTQYKLNLFLSNFAEAQIDQYPCCDYHKLKFVAEHCRINGVGDLEYTDDKVHFSKSTADSILDTYTGNLIQEENAYNVYTDCSGSGAFISFSEDVYYCAVEDEPADVYVAVADRLFENEDGTYTVKYRVFLLDSDFTSYDYSAIYGYTVDEAVYDWNLAEVYRAEAVVRDYVRSSGTESYQLISLNIA